MVDGSDSTAVGRRIRAENMPRTAVLVRALVGSVGIVVLGVLLVLTPPDSTEYFVLFLAAAVMADLLFSVRVGGAFFSVSTTFVFAYLVLGGTIAVAVLAALTRLVVWLIRRGLRLPSSTSLYVYFSVGEAALVTLAAGGVAALISRGAAADVIEPNRTMITVLIFGVAHFVFALIVTGLVAAARGLPMLRPFLAPAVGTWPVIGLAISLPLSLALVLIARTGAGVTTSVVIVVAVLGVISLVVKLNVRLRDRTRDLMVVNRIGTRLAAAIDESELLRILARESLRVLGWDGFVIAILDDAHPTKLNLVFLTGEGEEIAHRTTGRGQGIVGQAIAERRTIRWERAGKAESEAKEPGVRRPESVVVVPMWFDEEVIGAIAIQSESPAAWDRGQVGLLETIASQAAVAIRNADLFYREQRAREELDDFFSVVTHEIRNPLTSIRGYADLLTSDDDPAVREAGDVIRGEAQKILRLADDLLDAAKAAEGKFSIEPSEVDVVPLVTRLVQRWRSSSGRTIELVCVEESCVANIDATRIEQVLENLISNAVKYTRQSDSITVSTFRQVDGTVVIEVADTGGGIPPEKSVHLFERFYRVDGTSKIKGTGLGLHISREIVRAHGGDLTFRSQPGAGTTFVVVLPALAADGFGGGVETETQ